jgi:ABC-type nitrate/sulfonate/bicarbonate transport system substrate-binding protein
MLSRLSVAAAALLMSFGGVANAQQPIKVRLGVVTVSSQMALQIAVEKGMFAKHGFDVTLIPLASGAQANQALAANQVDWSAGGVESTVVAASVGLPFKPYAMYAKGGDSLGILVSKASGIRTARDLKGKRIAVVTGTASAEGLTDVLKANGMDANDVKRVTTTFGTMGQMLAAGAVDGMVGLEPFLTVTMEKMGDKAVLLIRLGTYVQGGGFFLISDRWAAAHSNKIQAAVEGLAEAQQFIRQHPHQAAQLNASFVKADAGVIERSSKSLDFSFDIDPFTISSLKQTDAYLYEDKDISHPVDVDHLIAEAEHVTKEVSKQHPDLLK